MLIRGVGVDSIGRAGGLIVLWNEVNFEVWSCITNNRCIILEGELQNPKRSMVFCNVYAANVEQERK